MERVLEQPLVYRLWQAPFINQKVAPVLAHSDVARVRRVLDVGCGPAMNAHLFPHADYLGIDINPKYIQSARRRFNRNFLVADATTYSAPAGDRYDFILVNSFLHHVDDSLACRVLSQLATLLTNDGRLHSVEVVMPPEWGIPRMFARWDRGRYCRRLSEWRDIFSESLGPVVFEPFLLRVLGLPFLEMIYFQGRARR